MRVGHRTKGPVRACPKSLGLLALFTMWGLSSHAAESYSEDAIKAAYLYRFAGYVTWPEPVAADAPFVIDVVGAPGVAVALRTLLRDHTVNGHAVVIREVTGAGDWGTAQMVYAGIGHGGALRTLRPGTSARLIVTDQEDGFNTGSVINLLTIDRNVRFEISLTAADRWGLKISSELLGVALRVQGRKQL